MEIKPTVLDAMQLSTTEWREIVLSNAGTVLLHCRSPIAIHLASSATPKPNEYFTISAGLYFEMESKIAGSSGLWARSSVGNPYLEIIYLTPE